MERERFLEKAIGIIGKNQILEEELLNGFEQAGLKNEKVLFFDDNIEEISMDVEDEEARFYLPLKEENIKSLNVFLIIGSLSDRALKILNSIEENVLFLLFPPCDKENFVKLLKKDNVKIVKEPEVVIISQFLKVLKNFSVNSFYYTIFDAVSSKGKGGIKELFDQTVAVLNFIEPEKKVFPNQIAFNLIPSSEIFLKEDEDFIRKEAEYEGSFFRRLFYVPIFYGTYINFICSSSQNLNINDLLRSLKEQRLFEFKNEVEKIKPSEEYLNPLLFFELIDEKNIWGVMYYDKYKFITSQTIEIIERWG